MDTADSAKQTPNENLHATAVDELYHFAVNNFPKLDSDHNGYISKEELDNALQVGTYQGADAAKVRALRDHVDDIAKLSDDGWFTQAQGISPQDLVQLDYLWDKRNTNISYAERIADFGAANFDKLDFDKRGQLMGYEIVAEHGDGCYAPEKQAIVGSMSAPDQDSFMLLHRNLSYIGHSEPVPDGVWMCKPYQYTTQYGITREELAGYPKAVAHRPQYGLINQLNAELKITDR